MNASAVTLRHVGGPTTLIEMAGHKFLTDPTFDPPGSYETPDYTLTKTTGPAVDVAAIGEVDAVLLSHHQHADNLDRAGQQLLAEVPRVFSTVAAAAALGSAVTPLEPWQHEELTGRDGRRLRVTAVPAEHGPPGLGEVTGPVVGFVLSGHDLPTVYVSGDNASLDAVRQVAERFPDIDLAVLHGGRARAARLGPVDLTLAADDMVAASEILDARWVVPVHTEGWEHFSEGIDEVRTAFAESGHDERLLPPPAGAAPITLE
jgi:L-ascorbate metabolism protein UlaG (beta-lactamase superfamily)